MIAFIFRATIVLLSGMFALFAAAFLVFVPIGSDGISIGNDSGRALTLVGVDVNGSTVDISPKSYPVALAPGTTMTDYGRDPIRGYASVFDGQGKIRVVTKTDLGEGSVHQCQYDRPGPLVQCFVRIVMTTEGLQCSHCRQE